MITIHTFENTFDEGKIFVQFVQRENQELLDSLRLSNPPGESLFSFLHDAICLEALQEPDVSERNHNRFYRILHTVALSGDIDKLIGYSSRVCVHGSHCKDLLRTRFGEWCYDKVVIDISKLQEQ